MKQNFGLYVEDFRETFGYLVDYCVRSAGMTFEQFIKLGVDSKLFQHIDESNPRYIAGQSAVELGDDLIEYAESVGLHFTQPGYPWDPEYLSLYWTGWVLIKYVYSRGLWLSDFITRVDLELLQSRFYPAHEASEETIFELLDTWYN